MPRVWGPRGTCRAQAGWGLPRVGLRAVPPKDGQDGEEGGVPKNTEGPDTDGGCPQKDKGS